LSFTIGNLQFIDSLSFIQASLETLVCSLAGMPKDKAPISTCKEKLKVICSIKNNFKIFGNHFSKLDTDEKLLLTQKGVYPYDYMNSFNKFNETNLPPKSAFYSKIENENISDEDYNRAIRVWKTMKIKNLGEYHDLYLTTDVLLLADVFESFRSSAITSYKLDPVHYVSLPGFAWDALLLKTGVKLDVQYDYDMYLMIERGIRGGISVISHRHAKANNKYLSSYDKTQKSSYIIYLDANNLYGYAMIQHLPTKNFQWCNPENFNSDLILSMRDDQKTGYIFDVDLEYPEHLHDLHNDYPLAPENISVEENMLSEHSKSILKIIGSIFHSLEQQF